MIPKLSTFRYDIWHIEEKKQEPLLQQTAKHTQTGGIQVMKIMEHPTKSMRETGKMQLPIGC